MLASPISTMCSGGINAASVQVIGSFEGGNRFGGARTVRSSRGKGCVSRFGGNGYKGKKAQEKLGALTAPKAPKPVDCLSSGFIVPFSIGQSLC